MKRIGITGGIGSGKSTIAEVFKVLGVPVYNSDQRAKWLMQHSPSLKAELSSLFGLEAYLSNGELNRTHIASIVFEDSKMLNRLNASVHPFVKMDFENWCAKQSAPYVLKEAAILIESGAHESLDEVLLVVAPVEDRVNRVVHRDGVSEAEVKARVAKQWSDEQKEPYADYIINNDNRSEVLAQVLEIHQEILNK